MKKGKQIFTLLTMIIMFTLFVGMNVFAADKTLKAGKWTKGTLTTQETAQYYKINVKKTGYIKIEYARDNKDASTLIYICDSKKKTISKAYNFENKLTSYVAVKKGTYYVYINDSAYNDDEEDEYDWEDDEPGENITEGYKIKYTFTSMKEAKTTKPGKGLNKAPLLKKNKTVSGLIFQGKGDRRVYYKLVVPKKSKVKFNYEVMGVNGTGPVLRIADKKGKFLAFDDNGKVIKDKDLIIWWQNKGSDYVVLDKGTYYFTIQASKEDTGYYKLTLK